MNNNDNNIPPAPSVADILSSGSGQPRIGGVNTSAAAKAAAKRKIEQEQASQKVIENAHIVKAVEPALIPASQPLESLATKQLQARENLLNAVQNRKLQGYADQVILDQRTKETLHALQQLGVQLVEDAEAQAIEIVARAEQQAAEVQQAVERRIVVSAQLIDDIQVKTQQMLDNAKDPEVVAKQLQELVDGLVDLTNLYAQPKGDIT